jgi:RimJ/RimL family protein N-acetyltransferase
VYLRVFSFNERAIRLYQKLGFYEEGNLKEQFYRDGAWHDVISMGLLKRNYKNERLMFLPETSAPLEECLI